MPAGPDTVVRGFYTYGGSLMKRGQLCQNPGVDYLVVGPRLDGGNPTRRPAARALSLVASVLRPVINSPDGGDGAPFFLDLRAGPRADNFVRTKWKEFRRDTILAFFAAISRVLYDNYLLFSVAYRHSLCTTLRDCPTD